MKKVQKLKVQELEMLPRMVAMPPVYSIELPIPLSDAEMAQEIPLNMKQSGYGCCKLLDMLDDSKTTLILFTGTGENLLIRYLKQTKETFTMIKTDPVKYWDDLGFIKIPKRG